MSAKIYWFSGTGNSLAVARALAEKLPDAELIPIAEAVNHPPQAADVIGIVCPVYAWGPKTFRRLVRPPNPKSRRRSTKRPTKKSRRSPTSCSRSRVGIMKWRAESGDFSAKSCTPVFVSFCVTAPTAFSARTANATDAVFAPKSVRWAILR